MIQWRDLRVTTDIGRALPPCRCSLSLKSLSRVLLKKEIYRLKQMLLRRPRKGLQCHQMVDLYNRLYDDPPIRKAAVESTCSLPV